jgi:hypothetical protein
MSESISPQFPPLRFERQQAWWRTQAKLRRAGFFSPQMESAKRALIRGPMQKFENGFRDQEGAFHAHSVVAALARRNLAVIEGNEARAR